MEKDTKDTWLVILGLIYALLLGYVASRQAGSRLDRTTIHKISVEN